MISRARSIGWDHAADNLNHFLQGMGTVRKMELSWLMSFDVFGDGVNRIKGYFETKTLAKAALKLTSGESITVSDYWVADIYANPFTELYYASGASKISGIGSFTLKNSNNVVSIRGMVNFNWYDDYDWHEDLTAYIPGSGTISDRVGLLMQQHRGASPYRMEANWTSNLIGFITPKMSVFKWSD